MPTITGTSGADILTGTQDPDTINGLEGNDRISGGDGDDIIEGGDGFDTLNGEGGDDRLVGGTGLDFIEGGLGDDFIDGGAGGERTPQLIGIGTVVNGGDVASYRSATAGVRIDLRITTAQNTGSAGNDTLVNIEDISGSDFNDTLRGTDGANLLSGALGDDQIFGYGGDDVLLSSLGNDYVDGGDGNDYIWAGQLGQQPYINAGNDTLLGGAGNDRIFGSGGNDRIEGGSGDDTLQGFGGTDILLGGDGADNVGGDLGDIQIDGGAGNDYISVAATDDGTGSLTGPVNLTRVTGGDGNDTIKLYDDISIGLILDGGNGDDVLVGAFGADTLLGGIGLDTLRGLAGNDTLMGGGGSDVLDGGDGFDTAIYTGLVRREAGVDTLISIEEAAFLDGRLSFDQNGNAAAIVRLYDATFDRPADNAGMNNWLAALGRGLTLKDVAIAFSQSGEFTSRYAGTSNDQFVREMYRFSLGREGDAPGIAGWVDHLASGRLTRAEVLLQFSESAEHKAQLAGTVNAGVWIQDQTTLSIARLYHGVLDRLPDEGGLISWRTAAANGATLEGIAAAFMGSAEFTTRFGSLSNQQFVEQLYRFTLDREGDASGIAGWVANLNIGVSRARVVLEFSESPEHVNLTRPSMENGVVYEGYAGHAPSQAAAVEDAGNALTSPIVIADKHNGVGGDDAQTLPVSAVEVLEADYEALVEINEAYDPSEIATGFKSTDAFVLPAIEAVGDALTLPLNLVDDEFSITTDAPLRPIVGGLAGRALTLMPDESAFLTDDPATSLKPHDHDGWA